MAGDSENNVNSDKKTIPSLSSKAVKAVLNMIENDETAQLDFITFKITLSELKNDIDKENFITCLGTARLNNIITTIEEFEDILSLLNSKTTFLRTLGQQKLDQLITTNDEFNSILDKLDNNDKPSSEEFNYTLDEYEYEYEDEDEDEYKDDKFSFIETLGVSAPRTSSRILF